MRKCMIIGTAVLLTVFLCAGAAAENMTALDAFNALLNDADPRTDTGPADLWLDEIMAGRYDHEGGDTADMEALAACLGPLSGISGKDITAYASRRGLKAARVRNAYYKALADALNAHITLYPAEEERYRNIQLILKLFLEPEADEETLRSRSEIRAGMEPETSRWIAEKSGLPAQFVEFVIMDENWRDASWENDEDWRAAADWSGAAGSFDRITIGGRDAPGSTRIADMQERLISLGYLRGKADGVFGPRSQAALLEFQLANGLRPTGSCTADDYERLLSAEAVARWDYGDDFWDSEDWDTLRNSPDTPDRDSGSRDTTDPNTDTPDHAGPGRDTPDTPDDD